MQNKDRLIRGVILLLMLLVVAGIVILVQNFHLEQKKQEITVGGVFVGQRSDQGWNESHYTAMKAACEPLSCELLTRENVPEDDRILREAVDSLVSSGCSLIFLTSYGYGQFADSLASRYPGVAFLSISGECRANNAMSYFARLYQARFIAGIVAGGCSKTGILGYVAAMPNSQANRGINAYALGARMANPDARVLISFTGGWDNEGKEKEAVRRLAGEGADVFTYHEDKPYAIDAAEEMGLYSTGYDAVYTERSERFLTAALYDWNSIYKTVLGDYLSGRANFSSEYWMGFDEGGVGMYPFSALVDEKTRTLAEKEQQRIQSWRDVFSGEIRDNTGALRCEEDERISDEELFNGMDWFVEGVEIYE